EPQIAVAVTRTMASVDSRMTGSLTRSTLTFLRPFQTTAFIYSAYRRAVTRCRGRANAGGLVDGGSLDVRGRHNGNGQALDQIYQQHRRHRAGLGSELQGPH